MPLAIVCTSCGALACSCWPHSRATRVKCRLAAMLNLHTHFGAVHLAGLGPMTLPNSWWIDVRLLIVTAKLGCVFGSWRLRVSARSRVGGRSIGPRFVDTASQHALCAAAARTGKGCIFAVGHLHVVTLMLYMQCYSTELHTPPMARFCSILQCHLHYKSISVQASKNNMRPKDTNQQLCSP